MITLLGGIIGIGIGLGYLISYVFLIFNIPSIITINSIVLSTTVSILIGIIFGNIS